MTAVFDSQRVGGNAVFAAQSFASGGSGTVSSSFAAAYDIKARVSSSLAASYTIRQSVAGQLVASYNVRSRVAASASFSYSVASGLTQVSASFVASYQVAQAEHPYVRAQSRTFVIPAEDRPAAMPRFRKAASAKLDYSFDWGPYLAAVDDGIASYVFRGPAGQMGAASIDGGVVTTWIRGGVGGYRHRVECEITTDQGRIDSRTMEIELVV
jgi:hypothetical protein